MIETIQNSVSQPILLEMLAEELSEACKAALKYSRVLRAENYTPVTEEEAYDNLIEEISDIILCMKVLNLEADEDTINYKLNRWIKRLNKKSE